MKNQELQSSLVKSGILVILCVFFIYAFAAGDSGGVTGTISSLFYGTLFVIGLVFAVLLSIAIMFGIYFGILYLYDAETCSDTYEEFKVKLADSSKFINYSCSSKGSSKKVAVTAISDEDLSLLRSNQDKLGSQLTGLQASVASLEKTLSGVSSSITGTNEEIAKLDEKVASTSEELDSKATTESVDETTKKLATDITSLQTSVKPLSDKLTELETTLSSIGSDDEGSEDDLQEKVDTTIDGIKTELATMKSSIESLASQATAASSEPEEDKHKMLSYFTKKDDEKKFIKLVDEAVKQGMTYAQVGEFLNDSLSEDASKIIGEHPSLTKDYIKVCRQNS